MSKNNLLLIVLILVGLAAALLSFKNRYSAEARNRRVELVIDWPDAQALANTTRQPIKDVLAQLSHASPHGGITSVALTEDTLESLRSNGIVSYRRRGDDTEIAFTPGFPLQQARVEQSLRYKTRLEVKKAGARDIWVHAPWPQFNGLPIGLDDAAVNTIRSSGLLVVPRLLNYTGVTPQSIDWELQQVVNQAGPGGVGPFIFSGSAVLGNRPLLKVTADCFAARGLIYGSVEFAKTLGDDDLSRLAAANMVRVHSIGMDEMGTMDEPTAVERFVRAARERNIRVCYIRLFINGLTKDADVIHANTSFIGEIVDNLRIAKLTVGAPAHPWAQDPTPGRLLRIAMGIGVMAGILLLVRVFTGLSGGGFYRALAVAVIAGAGLAWPEHTAKGREILALAAACVFPALGFCFKPISVSGSRTDGPVFGPALREYARITLSSFAGALFVVGLLSGRLFLLKVEQFLGVKLVLVAPVALVTLYYVLGLADLGPDAAWSERVAVARARIESLLSRPLRVGQVITALVALVALGLFVARSGNDPGVGVSATELKVRALLDKYLLVRPRTKEFLLGHPALMFALAAAYAGRYRRAIVPLLVLGAVGQASLVDTFCHLHTPLFLSLLRALIGLVLGGIIGIVAYVVARRIESAAERAQGKAA